MHVMRNSPQVSEILQRPGEKADIVQEIYCLIMILYAAIEVLSDIRIKIVVDVVQRHVEVDEDHTVPAFDVR